MLLLSSPGGSGGKARGACVQSEMKNKPFVLAVSVVLAGVMISSGCARKQETVMPAPEMSPQPPIADDVQQRVTDLSQAAVELRQAAYRLPGRGDEQHRQFMQQFLTNLSQILPILEGPNAGGAFRQQLRIVESARTQLGGASSLSMEPTIDTGLRAAYNALHDIAGKLYFDQPELDELLANLGGRIDALDTTRGPFHQLAAADAAQSMSDVVSKMSEVLSERAANEPATQPQTAPAPLPDTAPAE